ncbi:RagB/SusD family nutrient uptake outer membrane protein [Pseudobacter ginsenosidimutans]|uniref:SusD-like starch-binding protein associating with outer membrane n=1 Tax=Pseudobacter ginsenosidimutans TaxID=661488 RepID=A0A4Q7N3L8_9BACT|nr:RagB/SusD family nutrient uptake outer membrane protein [Pseudobacter ginsenosidimutans]RZS75448.1 SusD-like starch-binding protein associating with outer membrane [Pseudobacter ginsenosidimutans]
MPSHIKRTWILLLCILFAGVSSCKKFLATYSQNDSFVESAADLDELLVGEVYTDYQLFYTPEMLHLMDDDIAAVIPEGNNSNTVLQGTGFHYWQAQPRITTDGKIVTNDIFFNSLFSKIAHINSILHIVPSLQEKGEPAATLKRISGEALFLRAFYYFMLVNTYGKPYTPATASTDFGVPLKTDPAIKDQFVARNTTRQVYDQVIADLLEAEKALAGANASSTIRVNQAAAQAFLSRVYLYMENYEKAVYYADQVINTSTYHLKDLNTYNTGDNFLNNKDEEVIFTMRTNYIISVIMALDYDIPPTIAYKASEDLILGYSPADLRLQVFFQRNSRGEMRVTKRRTQGGPSTDDVGDIFLLRLSETYLNKAEALAALDRSEEARNTLQEFRKTRFKPSELPPVNATGEALVNTIRDERRLELCFEAHRWFDLRRYGVNSKYPFSKSITHRSVVFGGNGYIDNGYYELGPYEQDAAAYVVPIANDEIEFNNGLLTNEPRPARPLKQ